MTDETDEADARRGDRWRRRGIVLSLGIAGAGAWLGWPRIAPRFVGAFDFESLEEPPGFRRIAGGEISGLPNAFIGLDPPEETASRLSEAAETAARADPCGALFGTAPAPGVVPIASFSDYNCPFCRVLTERLVELEARSAGGVRMAWHEWPLLGSTSVDAARAAIAADMQGAYAAFHQRLMRGRFVATVQYLELLAEDIGIDGTRLVEDMGSDAVSDRLRTTAALAGIFRFAGTPALVVGRTVVVGAMSAAEIAALVEQERRDGPLPACRT